MEPQVIAENITLRTDTYLSPEGAGFRVICSIHIPSANLYITRIKNHGPDTLSELDWPAGGIELAVENHIRKCVEAGKAHVIKKGFGPDEKVILLNKFVQAEKFGQNLPKMYALYQWFEAVQTKALQGKTDFGNAPHSFEEVLAELPTA